MIPLAMAAARRSAVDPMLMGVALNSGVSTGGFAPTSLFGIVTVTTARQAGIGFSLGYQPDLGVIAFGLGAVLALMYPEAAVEGIRRIDWSTIFMFRRRVR